MKQLRTVKTAAALLVFLMTVVFLFAGGEKTEKPRVVNTITVTDSMGREVEVPLNPSHVICSGAGSLRLLVYLGAHNRIIAVDDMEKRRPKFEARPYALANPGLKDYPLFGEFRGRDNPELIAGLDPQPDVIFKTYGQMGYNPQELQDKTGVPVVVLEYGDLAGHREDLFRSIRIMAKLMGKESRGVEIIAFFEKTITDLEQRTSGVPDEQKKTCYIGGIAFKGPHGFQSTEPAYPPFLFTNAGNVAYDPTKPLSELSHADIAKEKIVEWDPEYLFVDLTTIQSGEAGGALYELANDTAYRNLTAVKQGKVYGLLPYNWYTQNFGSIFADAYFIGSVLYPDKFDDIDPAEKADEIYEFLVGEPVFDEMNRLFQNLAFMRIPIEGK
jgi:iron complex transport system substrate-binding protein